jgi:dihydroxyacetone kinase-like protein
MSIDAAMLRAAAQRARHAADTAHDELNAADGKLGDGDTGVMLRRLFDTIAAASPPEAATPSDLFHAWAKACAGSTGSSLGTLVTVTMMTLAKATRGQDRLDGAQVGPLMLAVRDQMMARGGAQLGDKTVVDMVDAVGTALDGADDASTARTRARAAAHATLDAFRDRPNRLGRARMFGDRTIGLDDPGMLAFVRLLDAVSG